jgi:predicted CoA-binding protein
VILGASPKPARYANRAQRLLTRQGYRVTPVHPRYREVEGLPVAAALAEVTGPVDTVTLYVSPTHLEPLLDELIALGPRRVIFNPGTESQRVQDALDAAGIDWLEACTLVMLNTGQF